MPTALLHCLGQPPTAAHPKLCGSHLPGADGTATMCKEVYGRDILPVFPLDKKFPIRQHLSSSEHGKIAEPEGPDLGERTA